MSDQSAFEDPDVAGFVDAHLRAALASARQTMETLRALTPELDAHLTERAATYIKDALGATERAYSQLHHAGQIVLGEDDYRAYIEAQTARRIG